MVVEYAALQLLDKCNVGSNMWNFDYYFLPIVNPDGLSLLMSMKTLTKILT